LSFASPPSVFKLLLKSGAQSSSLKRPNGSLARFRSRSRWSAHCLIMAAALMASPASHFDCGPWSGDRRGDQDITAELVRRARLAACDTLYEIAPTRALLTAPASGRRGRPTGILRAHQAGNIRGPAQFAPSDEEATAPGQSASRVASHCHDRLRRS
jgi:hypothetical protein